MKISKEGIELIKKFEGCKLSAYQDSVGVWTIGYGTTNADKSITGAEIKSGLTISQATADEWLEKSVNKKYSPLVEKYDSTYHWNQNQFDALVSFSYNIGSIDGLTAKGTRSIAQISAKIPDYCHAGEKVLNGLLTRRNAEKALFDRPVTEIESEFIVKNIYLKVFNVLNDEVGYLEKNGSTYLDDKTNGAGDGNFTKYWRDLAPSMQGQAWCQCFMNWGFYKAYGKDAAKMLLCYPSTSSAWSYYTPTSAGYFKSKGQWYTTPKQGDIVYFKNSERIYHVGLVYKVDSQYIYTIEGNTSSGDNTVVANGGGVFRKKYALSYSRIAGYGRPNYDPEGSLTYYAISVGTNGLCVTDDLNIRQTPGSDGVLIGAYKKDARIYPTEKTFVNGSAWLKTDKGWVSGKYVTGWIQESNGKWWWVLRGYQYYKNEWFTIGNDKFYSGDDGYCLMSEWLETDGKAWYFDKDCYLARDKYIKSTDASKDIYYYVDADGLWDSSKDTNTPPTDAISI